jgi:peptidoglycan/LPS O-acetylase OafA/YrhL
MAVVTVTTSVFAMLFLSPFGPQKETAKMLLSAASHTTNFVLMPQSYFSLDPKANPLLHLWSLAVEEQFYFVWPIAIILCLVFANAYLYACLSLLYGLLYLG